MTDSRCRILHHPHCADKPDIAGLIGIAGGIGSGKSVVSRILRLKGFHVYDCDSQAQSLMADSAPLRESLAAVVGDRLFDSEGRINKPYLAQCIFSHDHIRMKVNLLVHDAVKEDLIRFVSDVHDEHKESCCPVFVESAILAQSGLTEYCDSVWIVTAPEEVRIRRVVSRSGLQEADVMKRMMAQKDEIQRIEECGLPVVTIENNDQQLLLMQIEKLIENIDSYA